MPFAQMEQLGQAAEWSKAGGLLGLIIFALFVIIALLLYGMLSWFTNVEAKRQATLEGMINDLRQERAQWQTIARDSADAIRNTAALLERFGGDISDMKHEVAALNRK